MKDKLVTNNDEGLRTQLPGECFYCHQKIGALHKQNCVTITKRVRVRYSFEIDINVPQTWTKEHFEFNRNEGTWCSDNALGEIRTFLKETNQKCSCEIFKAKFLKEV